MTSTEKAGPPGRGVSPWAVAAGCLVLLGAGFWIGQHPFWNFLAWFGPVALVAWLTGLGPYSSVAVLALLLLAVAWLVSRLVGRLLQSRGRRIRYATTFCLLASLPLGMFLGGMDVARACRDAMARGGGLQAGLEAYRMDHGSYPEDLSKLPAHRVPGNLLLGGSILSYQTTSGGYLACLPGLVTARCLSQDREDWYLIGPD